MIVKRIQIEDFEDIDHFESFFDLKLAVLPRLNAVTITKAAGVVLKNRFLCSQKFRANRNTVIKAEISLSGEPFFITATYRPKIKEFEYTVKAKDGNPSADFYDMIRQNKEEASLSLFSFDKSNRYSDRLKRYKDVERYYSKERFSELTNGIGNTRLFRACLDRHIKDCAKSAPKSHYGCQITIDDSGRIFRLGGDASVISDDVLFEYTCFLSVNRLWQRIESIRDLHHISWPLFIIDLFEHTEKPTEISNQIKKTVPQDRQIFVCDPLRQNRERGEKKIDEESKTEQDHNAF